MPKDLPGQEGGTVKRKKRKKKVHNSKGPTFDQDSSSESISNGESLSNSDVPQKAILRAPSYSEESIEEYLDEGSEIAPEFNISNGDNPPEPSGDDEEDFFQGLEEHAASLEAPQQDIQDSPELAALNNNGQFAYVTSKIDLKKGDVKITIPKFSKIVISNTKVKKKYNILYCSQPEIGRNDGLKISSKKCLLTNLDTAEAEKVDYSGATGDTSEMVLDGAEMGKDIYDNFIGNDGMSGMVDHLSKTKYQDGDIRALKKGDDDFSQSNTDTATNLAFAGDGAAALFGFITLIRSLKSGDNAWETYENFLNGFYGATKVVEGVGKVVGAATGDQGSADTGVAAEMVTHEIGAIKSAFLLIKKSVDLYKHHDEMSTKEQAFMGASMLSDATKMAHEAMYMVKNIQELINGGTIGASVMASMPGLSVAINAIDLITQGFYLGIAIHHKGQMEKVRKPIEEGASNTAETMDQELMIDAHGSKRKHGKSILNPLVNEQDEVEANIAVLQALIQEEEMTPEEWILNKSYYENVRDYGMIIHRLGSRYKKAKRQEKNRERIKGYHGIIAEEKAKLETLQERNLGKFGEDFATYDMAKEMSNINQKRINRSILHILADIAQIAGDVMTLTGVGAHAGAITKASAAALEGGAFLLRNGKQAFNDKGARQQQKQKSSGEDSTIFSRNADSTKSSYAKRARRTKHSVQILGMLKSVNPDADETTADAELAKFNLARTFISASGASMKKLATFTDPKDMVSYLSEAMTERDL